MNADGFSYDNSHIITNFCVGQYDWDKDSLMIQDQHNKNDNCGNLSH